MPPKDVRSDYPVWLHAIAAAHVQQAKPCPLRAQKLRVAEWKSANGRSGIINVAWGVARSEANWRKYTSRPNLEKG